MTNIRCVRQSAARSLLAVATAAMGVGMAQGQTTTQSTQNQPTGTNPSSVQPSSPVAPQPTVRPAPVQQASQPVGQQPGEQAMNPAGGLGAKFEAAGQGHTGLRVSSVEQNSVAGQAGLRADDYVISVDGRPFTKGRHLQAYVSAQAGRPVPFVVERNGRQQTIEIMPLPMQGDHGWLGVLLEENGQNPDASNTQNGQKPTATPNSQRGQNAPNSQSPPGANNQNRNAQNEAARDGAEITDVYPNGPAARAGLRPGDVILQINGQKVDDAAELVADIHEMKPQTKAELTISRDNQEQKIPVTLGNRNEEFAEGQMPPGQFGPNRGQFGQFPPRFPQGFAGQTFGNPQQAHQQLVEQNQRIEQELRQLREEIKQLREQLQKK